MAILHSGLPPSTKISRVKEETLSALQANVAQNALDVLAMDPPEIDVQCVDDFELCREIKEKGVPARFEVLATSTSLGDSGLAGWGTVFLQFRDRQTGKLFDFQKTRFLELLRSTCQFFLNKCLGDLLPITYTPPPMNEDDREVPVSQVIDIKGKRRASVELDESTLDF